MSPAGLAIGCLLCLMGWGLGNGDQLPWTRALGICGGLAILFPWPWDFMKVSAEALRSAGAWSLSGVLDGIGIGHFRTGNLLQTGDQTVVVRDALFGADGLVPMLILVAMLLLIRRRSLLHALLLLLSVPVYLIMGYLLSGLIAIWVQRWFEVDWLTAREWRFSIGLLVFGVQLACVIMTDVLVGLILRPVPQRLLSPDLVISSMAFNHILCWPNPIPDPLAQRSADDEDSEEGDGIEGETDEPPMPEEANVQTEDESSEHSDIDVVGDEEPVSKWRPSDWRAGRVPWLWGVSSVLLAILLLPATFFWAWQLEKPTLADVPKEILQRLPDQDSLPPELLGLKMTAYEDSTKPAPDPSAPAPDKADDGSLAQSSQADSARSDAVHAWRYEDSERTAIVSLRLPLDRNDLWEFDAAKSGWRIRPRPRRPDARPDPSTRSTDSAGAPDDSKPDRWDWRFEELSGEMDGHAYLWWCGTTLDAAPVANPNQEDLFAALTTRARRNLWSAWKEFSSEQRPCVQYRVFVESGERLGRDEVERMQAWFFEVRKRMQSHFGAFPIDQAKP
jgi:hypothetical protein